MLLVDADDRILLERRAESGIWGGLWSLPEFPDDQSLRQHLALRGDTDNNAPRPLPSVKHVFSHFVLEATPWHCRTTRPSTPIGDNDRERWFDPGNLAVIGLPQPIRRLLSEFTRREE